VGVDLGVDCVWFFDGRGLFVLVNPDGSRWWRFKYRYGGKERLLALGTYPEVKLKEAREAHERARKQQQSSTVRRQPRSLVAVHSTS
jgi:hypothetical protein